MITVMHWAVRHFRKEKLKRAASVSLSVDDRADFRIIRYRCSYAGSLPTATHLAVPTAAAAPTAPAAPVTSVDQGAPGPQTLADWATEMPLASEGVLGVFRTGGCVPENTIESHNADKSERMADSVLEVSRRAFQDTDGNVDNDALRLFLGRVRHFAADQGTSAQKCGQILANHEQLPNLIWVTQDPAHQVRIASKDPLHANEAFAEQWQALFNEKHALVPDIQNSEVWKARLLAAQQHVLREHGSQGGGLEVALRTFSFAKQRFDSTATPMMRYCCLIRAIAILCAMQACDVPKLHSVTVPGYLFFR